MLVEVYMNKMDDHNSLNLHLDSNSNDLYFLEMNPSIEKADDLSLDTINATYQPYETEPYLEELLQKKDESQDLQMYLEPPPDIPLCMPDLEDDFCDINIDQPIQNNDITNNDMCNTPEVSSTMEPPFDCSNEVYKEFLTFKTPKKIDILNSKLSYKSIDVDNQILNDDIQVNNSIPFKSIQSDSIIPTKCVQDNDIMQTDSFQVTNAIPIKSIQANNMVPMKNIQANKIIPFKNIQANNILANKTTQLNDTIPIKNIGADNIMETESNQDNNPMPSITIETNNTVPSKSIQVSINLPSKGIKIKKQVPHKNMQSNNYLPNKSVQNDNKLVNKEKFNDFKVPKGFQHSKKPKNRPKVIQDFVHISDRVVLPRAIAVLPPSLQLKHDIISSSRLLPPRLRFGPVQGIKRVITKSEMRDIVADSAAMKTPVFFLEGKNGETILIDTSDRDKANWLCLLSVGHYDTANVWLYEENNELYGFTTKYISAKTPLTLGYNKAYADKYRLPTFQPILDLTAYASVAKKWLCEECNRNFTSAALLQRHLDFYHKNDKPQPWRRYRCKQCFNYFGRYSTLKRHMEIYCEKNNQPKSENTPVLVKKPKEAKQPEQFEPEQFEPEPEQIEPESEHFDTEPQQFVPEPEQFEPVLEQFEPGSEQFEPVLELFEPESEQFEPEPEQFETEPEQFETEPEQFETEPEQFETEPEQFETEPEQFEPEPTIESNDLPSDETLQNFANNLDLGEDLLTAGLSDFECSNSSRPESELRHYDIREKDENSLLNDAEFMKFTNNVTSNDVNDIDKFKNRVVVTCVYWKQTVLVGQRRQHQYECNGRRMECKCERVFINLKRFTRPNYKKHRNDYDTKKCKRNIKTHTHNIKTAAVSLQRRLNYYLCTKINDTAAKRNRNVRMHHIGAEKMPAQCVEGGVVKCDPAAWNTCPRQYATRAILLQQIRVQHLHLVPPSKKKLKTKSYSEFNGKYRKYTCTSKCSL